MSFGRRLLLYVTPVSLQVLVSIAVLPLTTKILGPEDYAVFALVLSVMAVCSTLSQQGVGFILAKEFVGVPRVRQRVIMTTLILLTLIISITLFTTAWTIWSIVASYWAVARDIPDTAVLLAGGEMIFSALWGVIATMCVRVGAARFYAIVTVIKVVVSTIALLSGLFIFDLGMVALFIGHFFGGIAGLFGAMVMMRHYLSDRVDLGLAWEALKLGFSLSFANVVENAQRLYERTLLSSASGMTALGLYSHAQQYENMTVSIVRPASQAVLPVMLDEAQGKAPEFLNTLRLWRAIYMFVFIGAYMFALFGRDFINLITNGKFGEAGPIAALLIAVNLIRFACRPQLGVLMKEGRGQVVASATAVGAVLAIVTLALLVPLFGMWGAVIATYIQYFGFQAVIVKVASRQYSISRVTGWELAGVIAVIAYITLSEIYPVPFHVRGSIAAISIPIILFLCRDIVRDIQVQLRASLIPARQ